ncbi:MAG: hypothetical protein ACE5OR_07725 [bacterium]
MKSINVSDRLYNTLRAVFSEVGVDSEEQALKQSALLITLAKISKYEAEDGAFRGKYGTDFGAFEKKIQGQQDVEDFEADDDYMDWKFVVQALKIWRERKKVLENA